MKNKGNKTDIICILALDFQFNFPCQLIGIIPLSIQIRNNVFLCDITNVIEIIETNKIKSNERITFRNVS